MDEIFEQMLMAPSWVDGVGSVAVDSLGALQSLSKMGSMMPSATHVIEAMQNQGALTSHEDALFDRHQEHLQVSNVRGLSRRSPALGSNGFEGQEYQQASQSPNLMGAPWQESFIGGVPSLPSNTSQGKPGPFPPSGDGLPNDYHLGKRTRGNEDTMKANMANEDQALSGQNAGGASTNGASKPRVRARRGQATDPHSIAERNRRERIAERMKALQELVPDSNKTDKASMLDEIIGYVKFLQMQVKCLSMCRLGGASAAAPLFADLPAEGAANFIAANLAQVNGPGGSSQDGLAFAERQVARLMDEDMSAAMQYLQSKGLCLMPISLATAISSTGSRQTSTSMKNMEAGGSEKQGLEVQTVVTSRGASAAGVMSGDAVDTNGGLGKLMPKLPKEQGMTDKVENGLLSAPKSKEDAQR